MGKIKFWIAISFTLLLVFSAKAQDRYAVYFKYKPQESLSLSRPQEFLTQKAIERRIKEDVSADSLDLPVATKYLDGVSSLSDYVLYASKWMNAAVLVTDQAGVDAMAALPFVERVELVARDFLTKPSAKINYQALASTSTENNIKHPKLNSRELAVTDNSYDFQNELIGIDRMHADGYTGDGVMIAVFDAGFPGTNISSAFSHLFANNQILAQRDFVRPWNTEVFMGHQHGTNVLSLIAANEPGKLVSGAYDADLVLMITEEVETEYKVEEFNWVRAAEYSDSLGVDIISSSVGYWDFDDPAMNYTLEDLDGKTTVITRGASIASNRGILVVNSVGNYGSRGESSLVAPADAEDILSVGSVKTSGEVSTFSSRGPTGDGRFKPELSAFGDSPVLIRSNGSAGSSNGTSFSAPQITALAAGLWEAKPEWTKAELMENLFRSATQYDNPDNLLGYGIPNFYDALYGEILAAPEHETLKTKIYPNPLGQSDLKIQFGTGTDCSFELIDFSGRLVMRQSLSRAHANTPYLVSVDGIETGMYLVVLREGALIKQVKLLKQ
jgi:subtilisin family serine protease